MLDSFFFFFQAEDGIRDLVRSRGLGDVYKRQVKIFQIRDHDLIPQIEFLQIIDQRSVGDREFTGQIGFDIQILIRRLNAG